MDFVSFIEKKVEENIQKNQKIKKILIIDGEDSRAIEAAKILKKNKLVEPVLLVKTKLDLEIEQEIVNQEKIQIFIKKFLKIRKEKETLETATKQLNTLPFYGMMMLEAEIVDGVIGGLNYPTSDILRAAFKCIGPKKKIKTISSVMIMHKENQKYLFSDISVNVKPSEEQLAEIGLNASEFAKFLDFEQKTAFLSFSTDGSAVTPESILVKKAVEIFNQKSAYPAIGEIQFDAAINEDIRKSKYKKNSFSSESKIFIFPDLNSGNIGYKIAQRLGNFGAVGPIITGIKKPINDLSRGALAEDVYATALITALQAEGKN